MREFWQRAWVWAGRRWRLVLFFVIAAATVGGATWAFLWQNAQFEQGQRRILKLQEMEYDHLISFVKAHPDEFKVSSKEFCVSDQVEKIGNDTSRLLEMEFNKMQSEYEVLELWAALITVVFLLFSFFSMFKSEELVKQGHDAVARISELHGNSQTRINTLMSDANSNLREVERDAKDTVKELKTEMEAFKKAKGTEIETFMADEKKAMETFSTELKDSAKTDFKLLKTDFELLKKECQELLVSQKDEGEEAVKQFAIDSKKELDAQIGRAESLITRMEEILGRMSEHEGQDVAVAGAPHEEEEDDAETTDHEGENETTN